MVDLNEVVTELFSTGPDWLRSDDAKDSEGLAALGDNAAPIEQRRRSILSWLDHYHVLRTYRAEERDSTFQAILKFADSRQRRSLAGCQEILAEFDNLRAILKEESPRIKSGDHRDVVSLTSKALWLCYPDDVPIFDGYSERALQVLCRIAGVRAGRSLEGYPAFVDAWFKLKDKLESSLSTAPDDLRPIRVLDKLLWYLGQPSFEFDPAEILE